MSFVYIAVVVLYVFICFFLILVVLVQQGKGADLAGAFGGGGTQTAFGARGATTLLHKLTTGAFVGFILLSLLLTILDRHKGGSVMSKVSGKPAAAAPAKVPGKPLPATSNPAPAVPGAAVPAPAAPARPSGK